MVPNFIAGLSVILGTWFLIEFTGLAGKLGAFLARPVNSIKNHVPRMTVSPAMKLGTIALGVARQGLVGFGVVIVISVPDVRSD